MTEPMEIRRNPDQSIDEICIDGGNVHIEQMDGNSWFMGVEAKDGSYWQFWFGAKNCKSLVEFRHIEMTPALDKDAGEMIEPTHFEKFAEHILGDDDSELGHVKAERDYALHCLEREIGYGEQYRARIEALEAALRAQMAAILGTIGGTVEGHPTSVVNYLQRLRQLVEIEARAALDKDASE